MADFSAMPSLVTESDRARFLAIATSLEPALQRFAVAPRRTVNIVPDAEGFQGWRAEPSIGAGEAMAQPLTAAGTIYDFGHHFVGRVTVHLKEQRNHGTPVRVKFTFGETLAELVEPLDPYPGVLPRAWLQDETITLDVLPATVRLPRRYAFQYLKVQAVEPPLVDRHPVFLAHVEVMAETSADWRNVPPLPDAVPADLRAIDQVSLRTLANCMQGVFEDGPKRDRRLWLGDLRLQALSNYVTFGNIDLVKRCLYLHAALPTDRYPDMPGIVAAEIYQWPTPTSAQTSVILDYSALFSDTLLTYARTTGDWKTADDLFGVALDQLQLLRFAGNDGLFADPGNWWLFIDWRDGLDKQACEQAILIIMLRTTLELATTLKQTEHPALRDMPARLEKMLAAARQKLFDPARGVFTSGAGKQISWASQAWMALAGVLPPEQHAASLRAVMNDPAAIRPAGPYMWHVVVEALLAVGMRDEALRLLRDYWGRMVRFGASTFWEVFDPADHRMSPYKSHLVNSYCHAWSCTPAYFIRIHFAQ